MKKLVCLVVILSLLASTTGYAAPLKRFSTNDPQQPSTYSMITADGENVKIVISSNNGTSISMVYINGLLKQKAVASLIDKTVTTEIYDQDAEQSAKSAQADTTREKNGFTFIDSHKPISSESIDINEQTSEDKDETTSVDLNKTATVASSLGNEPVDNTGLTSSGGGYYLLGSGGGYYYCPNLYADLHRKYTKSYEGRTHSWTWGAGDTLAAVSAYVGLFFVTTLVGAVISVLVFAAGEIIAYTQSQLLETYTFDYWYKVVVLGGVYLEPNRNSTYWLNKNETTAESMWILDRVNIPYPAGSEMIKAGIDIYLETHSHTFDNVCTPYCNVCGAFVTRPTNHTYSNQCDSTCNICGEERTVNNHQYIWVMTDTGHAKDCTICHAKTNTGSHNYSAWENIGSSGEMRYCTTCSLTAAEQTRPHNFSEYWLGGSSNAQVCQYGGTWVKDCDNCLYEEQTAVPAGHIYSNACDTTCNRCGATRSTSHSYSYGPWLDVASSAECEKSLATCSICGYEYWIHDYIHAYTDCTDNVCNDCSYTRTAPGHSYSYTWVDVSTSGTCEKLVATCSSCGYSYISSYDYTHSYTDCTDSVCNDCGYTRTAPGHSYSYSWVDVSTSDICEKRVGTCSNCGYSYITSYDYTHAYTDCTDSVCNDCGYTRTAPGHSYTYSWVDVSTSGTCEKLVATCSSCGYSYISSYDYTHSYTDCTDSVCNDCGYTRTAPGHSYSYSWVDVSTSGTCEKRVGTCSSCGYSYISSYDYTHAYTDCTDSACNDCSYTRTAPGHSYSYGSWIDVSTSGTCEKQLRSCTNCGYSYWYYDYSHAWSHACDTVCNDCGYTRTVPAHTYSYKWVDVRTASTCEKYVATCTKCGYSYVVTYDYSHAYSGTTDKVCNDCGYVRP